MIRLAVRVRGADAELVLAELLELAPAGVEEAELPGEIVEYAIYGAPGELPLLPDLRAAVGGALVEISTSEIPDDWSERWRDFHRPVTISSPAPERVSALRVRAPWESPSDRRDLMEIVIDPGQAFGTGSHATTQLCLELLLALTGADAGDGLRGAEAGRSGLLDLGCGSGVLGIAAAALGYEPVLALDYDPLSVTATVKNAAVNHVQVDARRFDLRLEPWPTVDRQSIQVVLANLLKPLLMDLSETLRDPPAHLIMSGLLVHETDEVILAFERRLGMSVCERRVRGDWAAVWLRSGS